MSVAPLVLIIEDETVIQRFMTTILESNSYEVMTASTGKGGIAHAASYAPDIVLLDLGLPDMDGIDVLKGIRLFSKIPIVVVSARGHEREKVEALDLGADDYIVKPFGNGELLARIRTALRHRSQVVGSQTAELNSIRIGALEIDSEKRRVTLNGEEVHFTPVEYKIVDLLANNAGKVITHDMIMRDVWGQFATDSHLLRVNMANIRRKIEENPGTPRYILTEVGVGYRMAEA